MLSNLDQEAKEFVAARLIDCLSFCYGGEVSMSLEALESLLFNAFVTGQLSGVESVVGKIKV